MSSWDWTPLTDAYGIPKFSLNASVNALACRSRGTGYLGLNVLPVVMTLPTFLTIVGDF